MIARRLNLNVPNNRENKIAKTLTVANHTEVPIIQFVSSTCYSEVHHQNRCFEIEFAVANIKYNILSTLFFKENIQN